VNPERTFQQLCIVTMREFQAISAEVRAVIAELVSGSDTATGASAISDASAAAALSAPSRAHFAARLAALQQLEKLKLELTIHQQMLHNQHYVAQHPRAHGQLQEHSHHVHSVTDKFGRVRVHPSHAHAANGKSGLGAIGEDEACDGDHEHDHSHAHAPLPSVSADAQELSDNAQPFTRHLSALLSDTAFQSDSPFLFPPSGAAPKRVLAPLPAAAGSGGSGSTLHPALSAEAQERFEREVSELRAQERDVVERINEIIEEARMEVVEADDDEASGAEDQE
jgi:hypothetical protein